MKKNLLSGLLAGVMAVSLVACGNSESTPAADSTTETAKPATAENSDTFDVEMVGNSFSIEYCNINVDGARDAVDDLAKKGVTVNLTYNASADSSQVDEQINILNQALAKQPNAILIAACDSGALDEQMLDFIYIEDCVEAIAKISLADHNPHAEYNIGGGEVIPYTRIIDKARKLFPTAPIHVGPGDLGYDNLGALSVQRAFEDFGWKPRFSIEQGMEQYMNWLKNF